MFSALTSALKWFLCWMMGLFMEVITPMMVWLVGFMPDGMSFDAEFLVDAFAAANLWVPLDYFATLLIAFHVFKVSLIVLRSVMKLIPGIG